MATIIPYTGSQETVVNELTLTVTGMTCGGCESAVRRALTMIDGIADVTASHAGNTVTLRYDPAKIAPATIAQRIELLGYQAAV